MCFRYFIGLIVFLTTIFSFALPARCQDAKLKQALAIKPKQSFAEYDTPKSDDLASCRFETAKQLPGFIVYGSAGRVLRQFVDHNKDGKLDQWSYFKNGVEVYRDVDSNYDGKADQYRWLGSTGTRWGIDPNQDGVIDFWKIISAEEVAYEVFQAIKQSDQSRFECLLLTSSELNSLQLGKSLTPQIEQRLTRARKDFLQLCKTQKQIDRSSEWVHAGNGQPGSVAENSYDNQQDLVFYDHGSAVFKSKDYGQIALGTIVQAGNKWRLIELPELVSEGQPISNGGAFFLFDNDRGSVAGNDSNENETELAKRYEQLSLLEEKLATANKPAEIAKLEEAKTKVLEEFYILTQNPKTKRDWLENIADSVTSAYQSDRFPAGLRYLNGLSKRLKRAKVVDGLDYIQWRIIFAQYGQGSESGNDKAMEKAQIKLIKDLESFQKNFADSPIAADALCQLGIHYEISSPDETKAASRWYRLAASRFPESAHGKRAAGALVRLHSIGKPVPFTGQSLSGQKFNLQDPRFRDKIIVLHFWETWCADGLKDIQRQKEKFKKDVLFVGCNIEMESADFQAYLAKNRDINWLQLHAPGSMERSPLAQQLGVATEPLVLLFDKKGNLVKSNLAVADLEREIERLRRK